MGKVSPVFGVGESAMFAKALAKNEGIRVIQKRDFIEPTSLKDGSILIGEPTIYGHEKYMGNLHREISKQKKSMGFFHQVSTENDPMATAVKALIQAHRTEYEGHGDYEGRDAILADMYYDQLKEAGGAQEVYDKLYDHSPAIADLFALSNERRNDWQGYNPMAVRDEEYYEVLKDVVGDRLETISTKEELEYLIHDIMFPPPPPEGGDGDGDEEEGDGESGEGSGNSGGGESGGDGENSQGQGSGQSDGGGSSGGAGQSESKDPGTDEEQPLDRTGGGHGPTEAYTLMKDLKLIKEPEDDIRVAERKYAEHHKDGFISSYPTTISNIYDKDPENNHNREQAELYLSKLGSFSLTKKLRKSLTSLAQVSYQYGLKSGRLAGTKISRVFSQQQPRVFKKRNASRLELDCAFTVLSDNSGSMGSREKYIYANACMMAISEVLQSMKIPHELLQFSTDRSRDWVYVQKPFSERAVSSDALAKRFAHNDLSMGCNNDGDAIVAAAGRLAQRQERHKILIVLSDGAPAGYGTAGDDAVHLRRVVKEIESSRNFMSIIGIGIKDDNVKQFYRNSEVVNELSDLEPVLLKLIKERVIKE